MKNPLPLLLLSSTLNSCSMPEPLPDEAFIEYFQNGNGLIDCKELKNHRVLTHEETLRIVHECREAEFNFVMPLGFH